MNFSFFTLYSLLLLSFFLYLKSVPIYVNVHVYIYIYAQELIGYNIIILQCIKDNARQMHTPTDRLSQLAEIERRGEEKKEVLAGELERTEKLLSSAYDKSVHPESYTCAHLLLLLHTCCCYCYYIGLLSFLVSNAPLPHMCMLVVVVVAVVVAVVVVVVLC